MKKVKEFNKTTLDQFRTELDAVLEKFGEKIGVELTSGGIRFQKENCTIKLEAVIVGKDSREVKALAFYSKFKENDIIKVKQLGEIYIKGYNRKARKYPYMVETVKGGKRYKMSEAQVAARLSVVAA